MAEIKTVRFVNVVTTAADQLSQLWRRDTDYQSALSRHAWYSGRLANYWASTSEVIKTVKVDPDVLVMIDGLEKETKALEDVLARFDDLFPKKKLSATVVREASNLLAQVTICSNALVVALPGNPIIKPPPPPPSEPKK